MQSHSVYLHIPFCHHRCCYCDFNTYTGITGLIPEYTKSICAEISYIGSQTLQRLEIKTIFIGGGTPSLLPISELEKIVEALNRDFNLQDGIEITLEANPENLSIKFLQGIRILGVNRLSLGMQSAAPGELRFLERQHDFRTVADAVKYARMAGFDNINLDLMFGIPDQTLFSWQHSLEQAYSLDPDHLSLYALTLERGTRLFQYVDEGFVKEADPDKAADMYEWASDFLDGKGFSQYEISNWAQVDEEKGMMRCEHNLQYWHNLPYLGLGAGAHGFADGVRLVNVISPRDYIQRLSAAKDGQVLEKVIFPQTPATIKAFPVSFETEMKETMMMGLRLTEQGISKKAFQNRFGVSISEYFRSEIEELVESGLLEWISPINDNLRLTPRGRLLGNRVFLQFV